MKLSLLGVISATVATTMVRNASCCQGRYDRAMCLGPEHDVYKAIACITNDLHSGQPMCRL